MLTGESTPPTTTVRGGPRRRPRAALAVLAAGALAAVPASPALAHEEGEAVGTVLAQVAESGTETGGMVHLKNIQYPVGEDVAQGGTDVEFIDQGGRQYAVAGTGRNGMQIVDITDPAEAFLAATYDCAINQGDVQTFRQGEKLLATYTADSRVNSGGVTGTDSQCAKDLELPGNWLGTVIVDLTDPLNPVTLSGVEISTGSHNMTVHPSGNFLYNSNSELITNVTPRIEVVDITDAANPVRLEDFRYALNPSSLGANSHDVAFNADGTRGYSASLSNTVIFDTTDPAKPTVVAQVENPRINVEHDVKHLALPDGQGGEREFLLVGDEIAGAAGNGTCPGGGITVFEVTGDLERAPKDLGTWFIDDTTGVDDAARGDGEGEAGAARCTAHVFSVYPEQGLLTIGWYERGARVLDISGLGTYDSDVPDPAALGDGIGITEIGSYFFNDSDTWSFKTDAIAADGSFYAYGNDVSRGFDVYYFPGFDGEKTVPEFGPQRDEPEAVVPEVPVSVLLPVVGAGLLGAVAIRRRRATA